MSEENTAKRRRTDYEADAAADEVPSAATLVTISPVPSNAVSAHGVELMDPKLTGIPKLLMKIQGDDEREVPRAMKDLCALISNVVQSHTREVNREKALSFGAAIIVIAALRRWQMSRDIQKYGVMCLHRFLATVNFSDLDDDSIAELGGLEAAFDAMRLFPGDEEVVACAFGALTNISARIKSKKVKDTIRSIINDHDGVSIFVCVMQANSENERLQALALGFCSSLSTMKNLRAGLMKGGAVTAVATASEKYPNNPTIMYRAGTFMTHIYA